MSDYYAVLGLDLSLTATGICPYIFSEGDDEPYTLKFGTGKSAPKGDERLWRIREAIEEEIAALLIIDGQYDLAVIESLPPYAKGSAALGLVHGVAREILSRYDVPVIQLAPSSLKKFACGDGGASKEDMLKAFYAHSPWSGGKFDDNAVDSFWLQQVGLLYLESDQAVNPTPDYNVLKQVKIIK